MVRYKEPRPDNRHRSIKSDALARVASRADEYVRRSARARRRGESQYQYRQAFGGREFLPDAHSVCQRSATVLSTRTFAPSGWVIPTLLAVTTATLMASVRDL